MGDTLLKIFLIFLVVVNIVAFIIMGVDKLKAKGHKRRIPEKVLFLFAIIFGGLGGTLGMYAFRHKTKHWYFAIFFPALAIVQIAVVVWMVSNGL